MLVASGLFGSILGGAIANSIFADAFTIPMMKRSGFQPHVTGGVQQAASIACMLMPPIMGAGGFIMAELTGLPYWKIMLIAIFPALMYVLSVFTMLYFEARRYGIKVEKGEHNAWEALKARWLCAVPLLVITCLMLSGYSPGFAAIIGLVTCVAISHKTRDTKIDLTIVWIMAAFLLSGYVESFMGWSMGGQGVKAAKTLLSPSFLMGLCFIVTIIVAIRRSSKGASIKTELARFADATRKGAERSLKVGATVGVIGIIVGVLSFSGLVLTFSDIIIELADGSLVLTIALIALTSLVLGLGQPLTLVAYLILALITIPALTHIGVNEVAAHMIVYWLSFNSYVTPPFSLCASSGAKIAKAGMWRTALVSLKFAQFLYIGPFLFGYVPGFSLDGSSRDIIVTFVVIAAGTFVQAYLLSLHWFYLFAKASAKRRI